jgi:hypothetical protein
MSQVTVGNWSVTVGTGSRFSVGVGLFSATPDVSYLRAVSVVVKLPGRETDYPTYVQVIPISNMCEALSTCYLYSCVCEPCQWACKNQRLHMIHIGTRHVIIVHTIYYPILARIQDKACFQILLLRRERGCLIFGSLIYIVTCLECDYRRGLDW